MKRFLPGAFTLLVATQSAPAQQPPTIHTVRLINHYGSIQASVIFKHELSIQAESPSRPLVKGDAVVAEEPGALTIECKPHDGAAVNLDIGIPFGTNLEIETSSGAISLRGMVPKASLSTVNGEIRVTAPWKATKLVMTSAAAPRSLDAWLHVAVTRRRGSAGRPPLWELRDKLSAGWPTFGEIQIKAQQPGDTVLADMPMPDEAPVRLPWQAPQAIEAILLQNMAAFSSEEMPFNLVLLLDCSDSTLVQRSAMKEAVRRFVGIARPLDRVAVYVLANNRMAVVSPLTSDRPRLLELLEQIPDVGGASPVYDAIALAYEYELHQRRGERNALLVITDGLDNGLRPPRFQQRTPLNERILLGLSQGVPSQTSFPDLKSAAARMEALLYVVLLEDAAQSARLPSDFAIEARKNLKQLAETSGGRLFTARSVLDWDPVHDVATELRSLYSVAYYPTNQNFDGEFRKVTVKVRDSRAVVRTREGYYAQ